MSSVPVLAPAQAYALWAASYPAHAHNPVMLAEERAMLDLLPANLQSVQAIVLGVGLMGIAVRATESWAGSRPLARL